MSRVEDPRHERAEEDNWIDEQARFKSQAQEVVKQQAYFMKRALVSSPCNKTHKFCILRFFVKTKKHLILITSNSDVIYAYFFSL
jgi:hypothetical protein